MIGTNLVPEGIVIVVTTLNGSTQINIGLFGSAPFQICTLSFLCGDDPLCTFVRSKLRTYTLTTIRHYIGRVSNVKFDEWTSL